MGKGLWITLSIRTACKAGYACFQKTESVIWTLKTRMEEMTFVGQYCYAFLHPHCKVKMSTTYLSTWNEDPLPEECIVSEFYHSWMW